MDAARQAAHSRDRAAQGHFARHDQEESAGGHISVRYGDGFLISAAEVPDDKPLPGHVVAMHRDATFAGDVLPSSEWRFHRDILLARPGLDAVVHTIRPMSRQARSSGAVFRRSTMPFQAPARA